MVRNLASGHGSGGDDSCQPMYYASIKAKATGKHDCRDDTAADNLCANQCQRLVTPVISMVLLEATKHGKRNAVEVNKKIPERAGS